MTQSMRGVRDRRGRQKEESQKQQGGRERLAGRKRRALELGEQAGWGEATGVVKGKEGGESKRKRMFKTRHFPNDKIKCRVALRDQSHPLRLGNGRQQWNQNIRHSGPTCTQPSQTGKWAGAVLSDRALETLSECVIKGWVTEVGDPQGWALTILGHSPDLEGQLGCSNHCLDQGFPAHQPAHTCASHIAMPHMSLTYHTCHRVWGE